MPLSAVRFTYNLAVQLYAEESSDFRTIATMVL